MASLHKLAQNLFNLATDFVAAAKADGAVSVVQMIEVFLLSLGQAFDIGIEYQKLYRLRHTLCQDPK